MQVKSTVPFSEAYTVDPSNPPPEKDYDVYFKTLKDGITGKEALEGSLAPIWELCTTLIDGCEIILLLVQLSLKCDCQRQNFSKTLIAILLKCFAMFQVIVHLSKCLAQMSQNILPSLDGSLYISLPPIH